MQLLVTGGTGFIGSHTCVKLIEAGHEIVILDDLSNSRADVVDSIEEITGVRPVFVEGDAADLDTLRKIFSEHDIAGIIHFAGLKAVGESVAQPVRYYRTNLGATSAIAAAMEEYGVKRIVFSSSATVYKETNPLPFKEEGADLGCTNPYGWTKYMSERILSDAAAAHSDWSVMLLRYFNPVGAHESGLIGENPKGIANNLVPRIMQSAAGVADPICVMGTDYPTPDGTGVRDYIHVMDLARAHLLAIDYAFKHEGVEAINIGTGHGLSVYDILRGLTDASGIDIPYTTGSRRAGDIAECYADTEKAERLLGFRAELGLGEMCRDAWNYAKNKYN